jgi:hypothetical protein
MGIQGQAMGNKRWWAVAAAGAIVAAAGWGVRDHANEATPVAPQVVVRDAIPTLRIAAGGSPRIQLDAEVARHALHTGTLQVVLPDGTSYPVRIERQETHGGGHWSLVGRVSTAMGGQAMVLTFGPNAVFGQLPMPDGQAMQIETEGDGRITAVPAPALSPRRETTPDYRVPPQAPNSNYFTDTLRTAAAGRPIRLGPDDGLVRIDVLALYAPALVALRGGRVAAETQVAHLFAVANQAHVDSGTRVRFHIVGFAEVATPADATNSETLDLLTAGTFGDTDFEAMRDDTAADLVAFVRPHAAGDTTCGASWLNGANGQGELALDPRHGYVVANVGPCGDMVLAHELGHALGAAHDIAAQTDADGNITFGAFEFSFDLRTPRFATLMSDPGRRPWLNRFSSPDPVGCNGAPCGEAGKVDNARSVALMAPEIARFRE